MKLKFREMMGEVERKVDLLLTATPFSISNLPNDLPKRGIYLFRDGKVPLYVGRSNNIKNRLRNHVGNSHFQATFAFLLAREEMGCLKASYKKEGSRPSLLLDEKFKQCFDLARTKIKNMEVSAVEESDPTKQALLEIYAAFVTNAKYNNFDNH